MKALILDLTNGSERDATALSTSVSFRKFIDFVKETARIETSIRKTYLENAVAELSSQAEFFDINTISQATEFTPLLKIIYDLLTPSLQHGENMVWAIGMPLSPVIFYGTDLFYNLAVDQHSGERRTELIDDELTSPSEKDKVLMVYSLILERLYGITTPDHKSLIINTKNKETGIPQYFRINIDNRFTDVYPISTLPEIEPDSIQELLTNSENLGRLPGLLPLSLFHFEGISIITLTDVTTEFTLEHIKTAQFEKHQANRETLYRRITDSLRILAADPRIDFGLIPQLWVNNKLVIDRNTIFHTKLISSGLSDGDVTDIYLLFTDYFAQNPGTVFIPDRIAPGIKANEKLSDGLIKAGIKSYVVLPVYNDNLTTGFVEVYSTEDITLDEKIFSKILPANPLIFRIFQNIVDEFNLNIENVIKEKFTSVQHAVQWKFQEVAWQYLRENNTDQLKQIEKIVFKNVFPLYGAVDIRNSTSARNDALSRDLRSQLKLIISVFSDLSQKLGLLLAEEMSFKCKQILDEISAGSTLDEMKITEFLDSDAHPFLRHFLNDLSVGRFVASKTGTIKNKHEGEQVRSAILEYFESIDPQTGIIYQERRGLEKSMQMINSAVNNGLDNFKNQVQQLYPAYFEKFRTDGVEYDIYIGQSIDPDKKFSKIYLKNVILWQLSSMASIARMTHSLIPQMKIPLETTQLIFVNSNTIDISFRDDERRFDVEGAYNIRYQVIKKRIDKVHVRDSGERLTQPRKIALVYFQDKSIGDYLDYIRFLQAQKILLDNLEFLELEELQGVSGLKALRVGVNLDLPQTSPEL